MGDDRIIERHGRVNAEKFEVGCQIYSAVIVPPCMTLASSTLEKLEEFKANGGKLIFTDEIPTMVDGEQSNRPARLADGCPHPEIDDVIAALPEQVKNIGICVKNGLSADGITSTIRHFEDFTMVYFANTLGKECDAVLSIEGSSVEEFDYTTGTARNINYTVNGEKVEVEHHFYKMSSVVFFVYKDARAKFIPVTQKQLVPINNKLSATWQIAERDENALTLDVCDCFFDGKLAGNNIPINDIQEMALTFKREVAVSLDFYVKVRTVPAGKLYLAVEKPGNYELTINGSIVEQKPEGWYRDKTFEKLDISGLFAEGDNVITLKTGFCQSAATYEYIEHCFAFESERNKLCYDQEIEAIYLVGDFGVISPHKVEMVGHGGEELAGDFELDTAPTAVSAGSIISQGFPFFNGRMVLKNTVMLNDGELDNRSIVFSKRCTAVTKVKVNGKQAGTVLWQPYEVKLDGLLQKGENSIEIELIGSLRNLLGPHHLHEDSFGVGPGSFFHNSPVWRGGLNKHWNNAYTFASFGMFI